MAAVTGCGFGFKWDEERGGDGSHAYASSGVINCLDLFH